MHEFDQKPQDFTEEESERWEEMKKETFSPIVISEEEYMRLKKEGKI